jgi:probable lipoprotein NlpC
MVIKWALRGVIPPAETAENLKEMANLRFSKTRIRLFSLTALAFCAVRLSANAITPPASISAEEARLRVIAAAEKYEHTPYRYGGLDKRGLDCSGLVYVSFYDALGVSVPRNTWGLYSWAEKITLDEARPGDLVFFKTTGKGNISHVGIFLGDGRFIHSASEGPATGVIYSSLDERYWSRTFAGTGRVLPEADIGGQTGNKNNDKDSNKKDKKRTREKREKSESNLLMGFAAAPTWNTSVANYGVIRGAAGQIRFGVEVEPFRQPMLLGVELRPEWDGALGVFRIPLTLSWGINDKVRVFAGPALSIGDAALTISGESRPYSGGTSWFGAAGITVAPFAFKVAQVNLAPYGELAWQSYFYNGSKRNLGADLAAGFRFSTGLSCTWKN